MKIIDFVQLQAFRELLIKYIKDIRSDIREEDLLDKSEDFKEGVEFAFKEVLASINCIKVRKVCECTDEFYTNDKEQEHCDRCIQKHFK